MLKVFLQDIVYYSRPKTKKKKQSLDEVSIGGLLASPGKYAARPQVDPELLDTFEKLGIPLTEQKAWAFQGSVWSGSQQALLQHATAAAPDECRGGCCVRQREHRDHLPERACRGTTCDINPFVGALCRLTGRCDLLLYQRSHQGSRKHLCCYVPGRV